MRSGRSGGVAEPQHTQSIQASTPAGPDAYQRGRGRPNGPVGASPDRTLFYFLGFFGAIYSAFDKLAY